MDFQIRKAVPGEEKQVIHVNIQTWKTAYKGIVDQPFLDDLSEDGEKRLAGIRRDIAAEKVYVAATGGEIVGIAIYGAARGGKYAGCGELYALYVLDACQRSGIGGQLVNTVENDLARKGYREMIIGCLSENPSCGFYGKMGGRLTEENTRMIGGRDYRESIYRYELSAPQKV